MKTNKIYITGLPRTGTTSICAALLKLNYKVAHTAFTPKAMEEAQVIADTPIFCDFEQLALEHPDAKFIHLTRASHLWVPSIMQLLNRMYKNVTRADGGFNPTLKRCFQQVFAPLTLENINSEVFLADVYQKHLTQVQACFKHSPERLLIIDVAENDSYTKMLEFLCIPNGHQEGFEKINVGGKITYWNSIKDPNKVDANLKIK